MSNQSQKLRLHEACLRADTHRQASQVITTYNFIRKEKDKWKLARWYSELSSYEWPEDVPGKPAGFDELPDVFKGLPVQALQTGLPQEWNAYGTKSFYVSFFNRLIIQKIGAKETLRYHHIHNLKRSRLRFELWWLKRWFTGLPVRLPGRGQVPGQTGIWR